MPVLVLVLIVGVFAYLWFARRGSTLTRDCRWRLDRAIGPECWRCAVCGAQAEGGASPRRCLRPRA
jgi:rubrerythrin